MKKILLSSLLAVMAVTSANAKIASTDYADGVATSKAAAAETAAKSYADGVATAAETAAKTYTNQKIGDLDATTNGNGVVVTNVTQTDGVVTVTKGNIAYSSLTGTPTVDTAMSDSSTNAVQNKVIKSYVDNAINTVEGEIGDGYQKLSDKLKSSDTTTQVTEANKDTLYPTVGKTQKIADAAEAAAEAAAKSYTDAEVAKKQDVISDLSTIREGASKGATAVQNFNSLTNETEGTGTNDGKYVTSVTQTNGKIKASVVAFDASLSADSTNAPQSKVVKSYVDAEVGKKQDTLSTAQLAAVNSGANKDKIDAIATNTAAINTINNGNVMKSGITAAKVTQYDGYASGKQNTLSTAQLAAVNSGATAAIINATSAFQAAVEAGTVNEEGTYVLTAKVDAQTNKVTGYAWENIDRSY